jgi:hypothetical protein
VLAGEIDDVVEAFEDLETVAIEKTERSARAS